MRVIAGTARRLLLKTVEGMDTRPTTDRIKETLFNMLQPMIPGCKFLDLFSGSGAIGIEALSRGAAYAALVEREPAAANCIRENLERTHLADRARLMERDVMEALRRLEGYDDVFDIVFLDPPYNQGLEQKVLHYLASSPMAGEETLIVIEASKETDFSWLEEEGYTLEKNKEYKTNKHVFVRKKSV